MKTAICPPLRQQDSAPALLPTLLRLPMSTLVAVSALLGLFAHPGLPHPVTAALLAAGVFLLAAGASTLNQVQEHRVDALQERTRNRPLPAGRLRLGSALFLAGTLIACGLMLLGQLHPSVALGGGAALLLYNGLYTPLKTRTPFALLVGALGGALPPLLGWCAAGGQATDHRAVGLVGLCLLWQIPHTWTICARYPEDIRNGPFVFLQRQLDELRLARLKRIWLLALAIATLQPAAFGTLQSPPAKLLNLGLAGALLISGLTPSGTERPKRHSIKLVLYMVALICIIILDNL